MAAWSNSISYGARSAGGVEGLRVEGTTLETLLDDARGGVGSARSRGTEPASEAEDVAPFRLFLNRSWPLIMGERPMGTVLTPSKAQVRRKSLKVVQFAYLDVIGACRADIKTQA